jgi:hypothetical protein
MSSQFARALSEVGGLSRSPQRAIPFAAKVLRDSVRIRLDQRHLYSYTRMRRSSGEVLKLVLRWIFDAQLPNGGVAAYYSLLTGYAMSYPEVTGYIIPTLYDFAQATAEPAAVRRAELATNWLLSLQMPSGAFPGGLDGTESRPSVFNTGQILQGLIRSCYETRRPEIRRAAIAAGDWLIEMQQPDGSWSGSVAYQGSSHTYYSMVAWALAALAGQVADDTYGLAAEKHMDWTLSHFRPNGWIDGINLRGHPTYLHFIAYALQGVLECAVLRRRNDAVEAAAKSAWVLLRKFEASKFLPGAYQQNLTGRARFACLTGNAQVSCVWLRLFEITGEIRYLNAALKMNEMLKASVPIRGRRGIVGGVSGSYPIWGRYQPLRYISWGCKFLADALLLEERVMHSLESLRREALLCAS